jgi:hypothetical protein
MHSPCIAERHWGKPRKVYQNSWSPSWVSIPGPAEYKEQVTVPQRSELRRRGRGLAEIVSVCVETSTVLFNKTSHNYLKTRRMVLLTFCYPAETYVSVDRKCEGSQSSVWLVGWVRDYKAWDQLPPSTQPSRLIPADWCRAFSCKQ